jgi:hypothetical protein
MPPDGTSAGRYVRLREGQARAMTRLSEEDHRNKHRRGRLSDNKLILAIIPAIITGAATYFAGARTGPALGISPTPTVTVTVTQPATSTSGNGGGVSTPAGQEIFHKTGVQLTEGYQLSFIDPTLRPMSIPSGCPGGEDLSVCSGGVISSAPAQLAVYPGRAGFSQCQADTTYVSGFADPNGQSLTGTTLCVTTGHRLAVCYITDDTTSQSIAAPGLTMDVTVYASK